MRIKKLKHIINRALGVKPNADLLNVYNQYYITNSRDLEFKYESFIKIQS